jgi:hypothetical protein
MTKMPHIHKWESLCSAPYIAFTAIIYHLLWDTILMQFIAQNTKKKNTHISEVQKYTEEYLSVLFTFFLHCNCWGIIQPP